MYNSVLVTKLVNSIMLDGMAGSDFRPLTNIPHCCLP